MEVLLRGKRRCDEVEGKVVDTMPNAMFTVELENGHQILAAVSLRKLLNYNSCFLEIINYATIKNESI